MKEDAPSSELSKRRRLKWAAAFIAGVCLAGLAGYVSKKGAVLEGGASIAGLEAPKEMGLGGIRGGGVFFDGTPRGIPLVGRGGRELPANPQKAGEEGKALGTKLGANKGRVVGLRREALEGWGKLKEGERVELPWFGEGPLFGMTHLRMEDNGWIRYGGELEGGKGSFAFSLRAGEVNGTIFLPDVSVALEIRTEPGGEVLLVERPMESRLCWPAIAASAVVGGSGSAASSESAVPQVNTRPGARGLIYINFEGGVVTDPVWNDGLPIDFDPAAINASGILEVVARVAEDYAPFDLAVSTVWADYVAAPVGRRTRVNVTPTRDFKGSKGGGVAMVDAWRHAGLLFSSTVPAWVFVSSPKEVAECVSHEVGHTLGLNHDGAVPFGARPAAAYYSGHGGGLSDPLSWAPIMGEAYRSSQTHWSRGEYVAANNQEDDIAIIKRKANGFGYIDESFLGVRALDVVGGSFEVSGVVHHSESSAVYHFATLGGTLNASLKPKVAPYGNVDLKMEVSDSEGKVWAVSDPLTTTAALLNVVLPEGNYSLAVSAANTGPMPAGGYATGYPTYGALGQYVLEGTLANAARRPDLLGPLSTIGIVGEPFLYRLRLTEGAVVGQCLGGLPLGVEWDPREQVLTGTPLQAGVQEVGFLLVEGARQTYRTVKVTVHADGLPVLALGEGRVSPATTPEAPWRVQLEELPWVSAPGLKGVVATSGLIGDGGASRLRYSLPAGGVASFRWKVSSESGCDFLECRVNGVVARDRDTGSFLRLSGVRDWSQQSVQVDGPSLLEFVYRKDFSLSEEQDRGWVAGLELGQRPVFTRMPQSQRLQPGAKAFVLEAQVEHATQYQWKKDGVSLLDGESGGRRISGARTAALSVTGAGAADSGAYVLEARNTFGMQSSRRAEVGVPGAPVVGQRIAAGGGLKAGDTLLLSVGVSSTKPFFVMWSKDGVPLRWTQSTVYERRAANASMSGRYSAVVVNAYGSASAGEVSVQIP